MTVPFSRFLDLSGGRMLADAHKLPAEFSPNTDSRKLVAGESFVCLRGPNFDGHDYISDAIARGAAAVVVDDALKVPRDARVPVIRVDDAKVAYLAGAAVARQAFTGQVIAVTGSSGKTTTKEFAAHIIGAHRRVLATPQNENNELGVAKVCYKMGPGADVAVVEFGARHPGEIAELVNIAMPDIGILTNIGEAHLEFFEDQSQLAATKFALFSKGARPVCNAADMWSRMLAAQAGMENSILWIRLVGDQRMSGIMLEAGQPSDGRVAVTMGASHAFASWKLMGEHHLRDALLAAGAAILAGLGFEDALAQFGSLRLPPGRFELHATSCGATIVYDAYNANPSSMRYALLSFAELAGSRHIAVLGSMAELGARAQEQHRLVGAAAASSGVDELFVGGPFRSALAQGAREAGMPAERIIAFAANTEVSERLCSTLAAGDCVLLKGSRAERMEEILERLLRRGALAS
jgi:UDP-N-acetylmuramoyl-tripeptide--D-alanyl-D-alanine ligase